MSYDEILTRAKAQAAQEILQEQFRRLVELEKEPAEIRERNRTREYQESGREQVVAQVITLAR